MLLTIPVLPSPEWVLIQLSSPFANIENIEKTNQEQTPLIGWKIIGLSIGEPSETTEKKGTEKVNNLKQYTHHFVFTSTQ